MSLIRYHIAFIIIVCFVPVLQAQFSGGDCDGCSMASSGVITINSQQFYCSGSDSDGCALAGIIMPVNQQQIYCSGGDSDGYDMAGSGMLVIFEQDFYCSGGDGDGYQSTSSGVSLLYEQSWYCSGSDGDGFAAGMFSGDVNVQPFYCSGGDGDGYHGNSSGISVQFDQSLYCSGGDADGFAAGMFSGGVNVQPLYCSGGTGDGYGMASGTGGINQQNIYCAGGIQDGYAMNGFNGPINQQAFYCLGSLGDGHAAASFAGYPFGLAFYAFGGEGDGYSLAGFDGGVYGAHIYCLGGQGDGYTEGFGSSLYLGIGIWTGLSSTNWNTGANWKHNTVPGIENNVLIPAGCPNYPLVTLAMGIDTTQGFVRCRGLEIEAGASMASSASLYVNGRMLLNGSYAATLNTNYSQRIYKRGHLTLNPGAVMKLGNQVSGTGITDLFVYSGGILDILGGTLEVDDQFRVFDGGTFSMSDGEFFVHKYGYGSSLNSVNASKFYIQPGALGGVSGGTIKVCGRESAPYHAISIQEPGFGFSGSATLQFTHGYYATHYDAGMISADGVTYQNLVIDKPGNSIYILSNTNIEGDLILEPNSALEIESGHIVAIGP